MMWPAAVFIFPVPFLWAIYKAIEWRWWVNGLRFGAVRFESDLDIADLMGFYWKVNGWLCLAFLVMAIWFGAVFTIGQFTIGNGLEGEAKAAAVMANPFVLVGMGLGYLTMALAFNVVFRVYLVRDLWAKVTRALFYDLVALGEERDVDGKAMFGVASQGEFFVMAEASAVREFA